MRDAGIENEAVREGASPSERETGSGAADPGGADPAQSVLGAPAGLSPIFAPEWTFTRPHLEMRHKV